MRLKILPAARPSEGILSGLKYCGGGIYKKAELQHVVDCVNFCDQIGLENLQKLTSLVASGKWFPSDIEGIVKLIKSHQHLEQDHVAG